VLLLCAFLAGCAALKGSKSTDNSALTGGIDHAGYPNAYLERIAGESIADLLSKRIVGKKGGRFSVVGIEPLDGTNAHGVDAEFLSKKIRIYHKYGFNNRFTRGDNRRNFRNFKSVKRL